MRVTNPDAFHWPSRRLPFFEGYYYKLYSARQDRTLALIPGVFDNGIAAEHHAFLQVLDSKDNSYHYLRYPVEQLNGSRTAFNLRLGNNHFLRDSCEVAVDQGDCCISGRVTLSGIIPWPSRWFWRGTMGPFGFLGLLEDYHQVCALHARLQGTIAYDGETIDFTDGYVYIEKDWGRQFPRSWIWLQSHFTVVPQSSVFLSLADVPALGVTFKGFIACLLLVGRPYVFATYNGASCRAEQHGRMVEITLRKGKHRLVLAVDRANASYIRCLAPTGGQLQPRDDESLDAVITAELYERGSLVAKLRSARGALEVANYFKE